MKIPLHEVYVRDVGLYAASKWWRAPTHPNGRINVRFRNWTFWISGALTTQKLRTAVELTRKRMAGKWQFT